MRVFKFVVTSLPGDVVTKRITYARVANLNTRDCKPLRAEYIGCD